MHAKPNALAEKESVQCTGGAIGHMPLIIEQHMVEVLQALTEFAILVRVEV